MNYWIIESVTRGVYDGFDHREKGFVPTFKSMAQRSEGHKFFSRQSVDRELIKVNEHMGKKPCYIVEMPSGTKISA